MDLTILRRKNMTDKMEKELKEVWEITPPPEEIKEV